MGATPGPSFTVNFNMPTDATIIVFVGFGALAIIIGIAVVFYCKTCMARMSKKKCMQQDHQLLLRLFSTILGPTIIKYDTVNTHNLVRNHTQYTYHTIVMHQNIIGINGYYTRNTHTDVTYLRCHVI